MVLGRRVGIRTVLSEDIRGIINPGRRIGQSRPNEGLSIDTAVAVILPEP